jgi:hypothetical protein
MTWLIFFLLIQQAFSLTIRNHDIKPTISTINTTLHKLWIVETPPSNHIHHRIDSTYCVKYTNHGHAPYLPKHKYDEKELGNPPWLIKTIHECQENIPGAVKVTKDKWIAFNASLVEIANLDCVLYIHKYKTVKAIKHTQFTRKRNLKPEGIIANDIIIPHPMYVKSEIIPTVFVADTSLDYSIHFLHDHLIEPVKALWTSSKIPETKHKNLVALLNQFNTDFRVNDGSHATSVTTGIKILFNNVKILFLSMLPIGSTNEYDELILPYDLNIVLHKMASLGATVSCFAWNSGGSIYNSIAEEIDTYSYHDYTHLVISATENEGEEAGNECKNCLLVGTSRKKTPDNRIIPQILIENFGMVTGYGFSTFTADHFDTHYVSGGSMLTAYYSAQAIRVQQEYLIKHSVLPWSCTVRSLLLLNDTKANVINNTQPTTIHGVIINSTVEMVLSWIDIPAMEGSVKPLIYDLDLLVTINDQQVALEIDDVNTFQVVRIPNVKENDKIAIYIVSPGTKVPWSLAYKGFDITWSETCLHAIPCDVEGIAYRSCLPGAVCKPKDSSCEEKTTQFCPGGVVSCINGIYPECKKPSIHIQSTPSSGINHLYISSFLIIYVTLLNIIHNS